MVNFFKACFFTATIWVLAALINALLYSLVFAWGHLVQSGFVDSFGAALFFSLLFSAPGIFGLWLVFVTSGYGETLSKKLLKAAFFISLCSCGFIAVLPDKVYGGHWFLLGFCIVLSAIVSVLLHHRILQNFRTENNDHV